MPHVLSVTSGNPLPCTVIQKSWLRSLFFLPNTQIDLKITSLSGPKVVRRWVYKSEINNA